MRQLLALSCLILAGCSAGGGGVLKLGAAGPWTEGYGQACRQGIELARDEINAAGGIRGAKLEIVFADDSASGAVAARVAKRFVDSANIAGVINNEIRASGIVCGHPKLQGGNLQSESGNIRKHWPG